MNKIEDYLEKVEQCQALASTASHPILKASYLQLADGWKQLAEGRKHLNRTKMRVADTMETVDPEAAAAIRDTIPTG